VTAFRVAVVDDDAGIRELVGGYLGLAGYLVRTYASGDEALPAMLADPPDLAIVDVQMPGLDGFGVVERMRREAALGEVPVLMLSALEAPHVKVRGLEVGADDYLVKHTPPSELLARVRSGLRRAARYRKLTSALAGTLGPDVGLDALVQALSLGARPARVRVVELAAEVVCGGGAIRACRLGRQSGARALERLALLARGRFEVEFLDERASVGAAPLDLLAAFVAADEAQELLRRALPEGPGTPLQRGGSGPLEPALAPLVTLLPAPALQLATMIEGELVEAARLVARSIESGCLVAAGRA
jgi:DNA-binding response OmpR family regulator